MERESRRPQTVTLFRPVGAIEYRLIEESGRRSFPPRLPEQPIFYPVANEEYAVQIARDWNTKEPAGVGYVLAFDIDANFVARLPLQQAGNHTHLEYWIPAEDLDDFNAHIVGPIRVLHEFDARRDPHKPH